MDNEQYRELMDEIVSQQIADEEREAWMQSVESDTEWQEAQRYQLTPRSF